MMRILQCSSNINSFLRYSSRTFKQTIKCDHQTFAKSPSKPFTSTPSFTVQKVRNICLVVSGGALVQIYLNNKVLCTPKHSRLAGYRDGTDKDIRFDWKRFWSYLNPQIWYFIAAIIVILGALAVALLNIQIPQIMGSGINVITRFSQTKDGELFMEEMKIPALKLLGMYLAQSACTFFYIFMLSHIGERIAYEMRKDLFSAIAQQDIAFFDIQRTGEIINRLTADIQDFKSSFKQTVSGGLRAATQIIGCSVSLVLISPQMTLFTLLCVPSVIVVGTIFGAVLRKTSRRAQAQIEKTTAVADEAVANIRTVRAFAMEDQERELFDTEAELSMEYYQKLGFGIGMFQAGTNLFLNGMVLSTLYMGGYLLSTDQLSAGDMMAFLMATQTIQRSLAQISLLFGAVMRGSTAGARVFEYINLKPVVPLRGGTIIPYHSLKGEIEFKNVNFAYPSRPEHIVLKNFNLKVPPGKTIAIVGASGNGKSTVVALIERFYDVNDGVITIDGTDIRNLDPTWLRQRALGLISQEPILFGTTVMENIRYGKPEASDLAMGTHESLQQQKGYYWTLTYQQQHIPGG
ncbi:atp-binding cassette sub-family b [Holotrichia oblita]|uniref:Atp-binding cassette sub-family b n=1 Tax=Holotrichia oblita TaxID=644536 RepID=A0ACB9TKJ8_HOLOL|nr:atp-binding cassette sub-family b [Holotrichia oblita]